MRPRVPRSAHRASRPVPERAPPPQLVVELFSCEGQDLAMFSWPVEEALPRRDLPAALADVLGCLLDGMSNAAIAAHRGTSVRTVANQVAALLRAYRVSSRVELARAAQAVASSRQE